MKNLMHYSLVAALVLSGQAPSASAAVAKNQMVVDQKHLGLTLGYMSDFKTVGSLLNELTAMGQLTANEKASIESFLAEKEIDLDTPIEPGQLSGSKISWGEMSLKVNEDGSAQTGSGRILPALKEGQAKDALFIETVNALSQRQVSASWLNFVMSKAKADGASNGGAAHILSDSRPVDSSSSQRPSASATNQLPDNLDDYNKSQGFDSGKGYTQPTAAGTARGRVVITERVKIRRTTKVVVSSGADVATGERRHRLRHLFSGSSNNGGSKSQVSSGSSHRSSTAPARVSTTRVNHERPRILRAIAGGLLRLVATVGAVVTLPYCALVALPVAAAVHVVRRVFDRNEVQCVDGKYAVVQDEKFLRQIRNDYVSRKEASSKVTLSRRLDGAFKAVCAGPIKHVLFRDNDKTYVQVDNETLIGAFGRVPSRCTEAGKAQLRDHLRNQGERVRTEIVRSSGGEYDGPATNTHVSTGSSGFGGFETSN